MTSVSRRLGTSVAFSVFMRDRLNTSHGIGAVVMGSRHAAPWANYQQGAGRRNRPPEAG